MLRLYGAARRPRRQRRHAAAAARLPGRRLVAGDAPGDAVGRTRSARWPSGGSPTPPTASDPLRGRSSSAATTYAARRHRPGLDPDHPVARPARRGARPAAVRAGHRRRRSRAAADSPSADLLAGWLARALRCPVRRARAARPAAASSACGSSARSGDIDLVRPDGDIATLAQPGPAGPAGSPSPRRSDAECLAEELRRLDPDEVYAEALTRGCPRSVPPVDDRLRGHRRGRGTLDRRGPQAVAASRPQGDGRSSAAMVSAPTPPTRPPAGGRRHAAADGRPSARRAVKKAGRASQAGRRPQATAGRTPRPRHSDADRSP